MKFLDKIFYYCEGGGTGIHTGLRSLALYEREGSNPSPRTYKKGGSDGESFINNCNRGYSGTSLPKIYLWEEKRREEIIYQVCLLSFT